MDTQSSLDKTHNKHIAVFIDCSIGAHYTEGDSIFIYDISGKKPSLHEQVTAICTTVSSMIDKINGTIAPYEGCIKFILVEGNLGLGYEVIKEGIQRRWPNISIRKLWLTHEIKKRAAELMGLLEKEVRDTVTGRLTHYAIVLNKESDLFPGYIQLCDSGAL